MAGRFRLFLIASLALNLILGGLLVLVPRQRPPLFGGLFLVSEAIYKKLPAATRDRLNRELADDREAMRRTTERARTARAAALDKIAAPTYSAADVEPAFAAYRQEFETLIGQAHTAFLQSMSELSFEERKTVVDAIRQQIVNNQQVAACKKELAQPLSNH